jgi:hypothetical protein
MRATADRPVVVAELVAAAGGDELGDEVDGLGDGLDDVGVGEGEVEEGLGEGLDVPGDVPTGVTVGTGLLDDVVFPPVPHCDWTPTWLELRLPLPVGCEPPDEPWVELPWLECPVGWL